MIVFVGLNVMIGIWGIVSGKMDAFILMLIVATTASGLFSIYVWSVPLNTEWETKEFRIHIYQYEDGRLDGEIESRD